MRQGDLAVTTGSEAVTSVAGSRSPCSSSTSMPAQNCSTLKRAVPQSMPMASPISRACSTVKRRAEGMTPSSRLADLRVPLARGAGTPSPALKSSVPSVDRTSQFAVFSARLGDGGGFISPFGKCVRAVAGGRRDLGLACYKALPNPQLAVLSGTDHGGIHTRLIIDFPHRIADDRPMIARIWSGAVRTADADEYAQYIRDTGFSAYGRTPGNRGAWMLRRDDHGTTEFITLSLWDSIDAIRAFAGDDIDAAVLYPEDARYLIDGGSHIAHYDVADHIPDSL